MHLAMHFRGFTGNIHQVPRRNRIPANQHWVLHEHARNHPVHLRCDPNTAWPGHWRLHPLEHAMRLVFDLLGFVVLTVVTAAVIDLGIFLCLFCSF